MVGHDVGTATAYHSMYDLPGADRVSDRFYSPALVELWRTAPYLHDGSAVSLREVVTTCNRNDPPWPHVRARAAEIDDLVEYLLSL